MKVKVYSYREKIACGNVIWCERDRGNAYYRVSKFAMSRGRFPASHPCASSSVIGYTTEIGCSSKLTAFRERGYFASCFPEGDGFCWEPLRKQTDMQCLSDLRECFGWECEPCGPWLLDESIPETPALPTQQPRGKMTGGGDDDGMA